MRLILWWGILFLPSVVLAAPAAHHSNKQILDGPFAFELVEVVDGDTFRARVTIWLGQTVEVKIRLAGIDTPEINGRCAAAKKRARQAKAFTKDWLRKNPSVLRRVRYDAFPGRVLATVHKQAGKNSDTLSAALLARGLAKPYKTRKPKWCA